MELIDRSPSRDTPWDPLVQNTATMFGTRAVNPILAAVMCDRINRPDIWPQSPRSETAFRLLPAGGRPHMGPGVRWDDTPGETTPRRCAENRSTRRWRRPRSAPG